MKNVSMDGSMILDVYMPNMHYRSIPRKYKLQNNNHNCILLSV